MQPEAEENQIPPARATLQEILSVLKPYKKRWFFFLLLSFVGMALYVQIPLTFQMMIKGVTANDVSLITRGFIWLIIIISLDAIGLAFRFRYGHFWLFTYIMRDLRIKVVNKVLRHSYRFIDKNRSGDLLATATNDIFTTTEFIAMQFMNIFTYTAQLVTIVIILYLISPPLLMALFFFFPAMMVVVLYYRHKIHPITFKQRMIFGKLTSQLQQSLAGIQTVQSFCTEPLQDEKFKNINREYSDSSWKVAKLATFTQPMLDFIWSFARLILIGIAGYFMLAQIAGTSSWINNLFEGSNLTIDQFVAFIPALDMFLWPITFLSWVGGEFGRVQAGYGRLKRILDEPIDIVEKENAIQLPPLNGDITFDNITFGYESNKPIIHEVSLKIPAGSTVAFLGPTGCGKSTLVHLLTRAYDVQSGRILLDNQYNIQDVNLDSYLNQVGIVAQTPFLFEQTFHENLTNGIQGVNVINMKELIEATSIADIYPFISSRKKGFDTIIGERGVNLSGGQKQRMTIARAILRKPKILILDAATSSVDVDTEYEILMQLKKLFGKCTTIIITQRLSTVQNADRIYIFDKGIIHEEGTHAELMKENGMYAQLYHTITGGNKHEAK